MPALSGILATSFFSDPDELRASALYKQYWFYGVELMPGVVTTCNYAAHLPMLPRLMLRRCELNGMECLDIGCMEGLMSVLMCRGGAKRVLAIDAIDHCAEKIAAVQHYYNADFEYRSVGLMYRLFEKLHGRSFDLINCSGLLYHVFSPLHVLAGIRPLLKPNGLLIVSTHVILDNVYSMEFNNAGRMQPEHNTFWYLSVPLLDYLLRYLRLAPVDCLHVPHSVYKFSWESNLVFDRPSAYLSVLCRATDDILSTEDDDWMRRSKLHSWEYQDFPCENSADGSRIKYRGEMSKQFLRSGLPCIDLWHALSARDPLTAAKQRADTYTFHLADRD